MVKPREGQRAFILRQRLIRADITEAQLARWEGGSWFWVSEIAEIAAIEAERVEWWLPEPKFPELPEEADDEDPDE